MVTATRSRWRHLAWLYPAATTFVVLASANHFVFDVLGGLLVTGLAIELQPHDIASVGNVRRHHASPPTSVPKSTTSGNVSGDMAASNCARS